jgi:ADP-heptose:LPS heptosyltransferase
MALRVIICFPYNNEPGLCADAAHLALGLSALGADVHVYGNPAGWRYPLRRAHINLSEFNLPQDEKKMTDAIRGAEAHVIHTFGADAANLVMPLTLLAGAGGMATLSHNDVSRVQPNAFRTASAIFIPCEFMRDSVAKKLPGLPIVVTGYLLPPVNTINQAKGRIAAQELGLAIDSPLILHADSLTNMPVTALSLFDAIPTIAAAIPGVQLIIAGDGDSRKELEERAIDVNNALGYRAVIMPGHRDDLPDLLAITNVAIGSGRFAAEAIGAGCATICAGAGGFIGVYGAANASVADESCFGRHGRFELQSPRKLASEIVGLLNYPEHRNRFAAEGQALLLSSSERNNRASQVMPYYHRATPSGVMTAAPEKIMVIAPDHLRDMIFILPAITGIKAQYPLAQMTLISHPAHRPFMERMGIVDKVVVKPHELNEWKEALEILRKPKHPVALIYPHNFLSALLAVLSFSHQRIGFGDGWSNLLLTDHLPAPEAITPANALTLAHTLGVSQPGQVLPPAIPTESRDAVRKLLMDAGIEPLQQIILISPQSHDAEWSLDDKQWEQLLLTLISTRKEKVAILNPGTINVPEGVAVIHPIFDTLILSSLMDICRLVIAPDSGELHIATLMNVPAIGIYGPTSPHECHLPGMTSLHIICKEPPCNPCDFLVCEEKHCLRMITTGEITDKINEIL